MPLRQWPPNYPSGSAVESARILAKCVRAVEALAKVAAHKLRSRGEIKLDVQLVD